MKSAIGRVAAVIVAGLATWLASVAGIAVSEETQLALTEGITGLGMAIWLAAYAILHKTFNRYIAPLDSATSSAEPSRPLP